MVNVASEAGHRGSAAGAAYTASKHAVVGLTNNSALTYGPRGLRFNAVAPGPTITNVVDTWGSQLAAERLGPLMQATVPAPATAAQLAAPSPTCSATTARTSTAPSSPPTAAGRPCRGAALNARGRGREVRRRPYVSLVSLRQKASTPPVQGHPPAPPGRRWTA